MSQDNFINELKVQQINENSLKAVIANLMTIALMILMFREILLQDGILHLLAAVLILNVCRLGIIYLYRTERINIFSYRVQFWSFGILFFVSLGWAFIILKMFPLLDSSLSLLFLLILQALATGGMINLSPRLSFSLIHINIIFLPVLYVSLMNSGGPRELHLSWVLLLYYLFLTFWAVSLSRQFTKSLELRLRHKSSTREYLLNERRYRMIFEEAPTGIFYYDVNLVIQNCNASFARILEVESESMIGLDMNNLPDRRLHNTLKSICDSQKGSYEGPYHTAFSDKEIWISLRTSPVLGSEGELTGGVGIVEDLTERMQIQEQIEYQAFHDALTDLPNRQLLKDRLEQSLKSVQRHGQLGALLFLDLDKFKLINDTMGHRVGDLLLIEVARRLTALLREEDTVARLGGDEFVVLLPNLDTSAEKAIHYTDLVCGRIHEALSEPVVLDKRSIQSSASIGVYVFTSDDDSADHILKSADTAMYDAKDQGRNRSSYYHSGMEESLKRRMVLEVELKEALKNDELSLFYQPIVATDSDRIVGAEALLRWKHSSRGYISPEDIINAAESSNQILVLGDWIVRQVLRQYRIWMDRGFDHLDYVSINISIKQIQQPGFAEDMLARIREYAVPPGKILLEITESILVSDFDKTVAKIRALRKEGVQFALDDFGTGFSSLSYLKRLPLDSLKIDRLFIQTLLTNHDDYVLIKTILSIAEYFRLKVICEGVEEKAQVDKLKEMGCELYQGYFSSRPVPPEDFLRLLS